MSEVDVCGRVRHFFARLGVVNHKLEYEQKTLSETLHENFNDEYPDKVPTIVEPLPPGPLERYLAAEGVHKAFVELDPGKVNEWAAQLSTSEHLQAVLYAWSVILDDYYIPFSSIMGAEKWNELCKVFEGAQKHLETEEEE